MPSSRTRFDQSNLLFRLSRATRKWRKVLDTEIQTSGLTDATWRPLLHLQLLGDGTRQKDLAESLGIKGPSLVRLLDALLAKGLIRRIEDESDRRAKLLYLTPEGQAQVNRIKEIIVSLEDDFFGNFNEVEIKQMENIVTCLESVINAFDRTNNDPF